MTTLEDMVAALADRFERAAERSRKELEQDLRGRGLDEDEVRDEIDHWVRRFDIYFARALAEIRNGFPETPGETRH